MRKVFVAVCSSTLLLAASMAAADPPEPKFVTNFTFEVKFSDGTNTYNENLKMTVPVWLPASAKWECERLPLTVVDGRTRGGFACSNDGFKTQVFTMIGCKLGELDSSRAAAMRIWGPRTDGSDQRHGVDGGIGDAKWIDLAVTCETMKR